MAGSLSAHHPDMRVAARGRDNNRLLAIQCHMGVVRTV